MCYNAVISQRIVTDALYEPVTLEEAKLWMGVDYTEKDIIIMSLITVSRRLLERKYGIGIIQKDIEVVINNSCGGIDLPEPPITAVTAVDKDDTAVTLTTSGSFDVYIECPAACYLKVSYKSGYELDGVPLEYKTAIKQQVLWMFEHLGEEDMAEKVCPMAAATLAPFKRTTLGLFL